MEQVAMCGPLLRGDAVCAGNSWPISMKRQHTTPKKKPLLDICSTGLQMSSSLRSISPKKEVPWHSETSGLGSASNPTN